MDIKPATKPDRPRAAMLLRWPWALASCSFRPVRVAWGELPGEQDRGPWLNERGYGYVCFDMSQTSTLPFDDESFDAGS